MPPSRPPRRILSGLRSHPFRVVHPLLAGWLLTLAAIAPVPAVDRDAWIFPATPSAGPRLSHSRGDQKVLVISVETADKLVPAGTWPPTPAKARQIAEDLHRDFYATSYGRFGYTFIYVPEVIRLPKNKSAYSGFASEVTDALTIAGALDARYQYANVDRVWLVNDFNWCGTGCASPRGKAFGIGLGASNYSRHELNHTNGLAHIGGVVPAGSNPYTTDWKDYIGDDIGAVFLRSGSRYHMHWLTDNDASGFGPRPFASAAEATGLHQLVDVASTVPTPGLFRGLRFPRTIQTGSTWPMSAMDSYFIGFSTGDNGVHLQAVANLPANSFLWQYQKQYQNGTFFLGQDLVGESGAKGDRVALRVGRTTVTPEGVAISALLTQPAIGGQPATIYTEVNPGPFTGNRQPTVSLVVEPSTPTVGSVVRIRAVASDPDGDPLGFHWLVNGVPLITPSANVDQLERMVMRTSAVTYQVAVQDRRGGVATRSVTVTPAAITIPSDSFWVDGTVVDADTNRPLPGVEVAFIGRTVITGRDGRFAFAGVPPASYNGNDRPRMALAHYTARYHANSGSTFSVATGRKLTDMTITLSRTVTDPVGVALRSTAITADEGTTAQAVLDRTGQSAVALEVRYQVLCDRATPGADFTVPSGVLTIPAGAASGTIAIPLANDAIADPGERLLVAITDVRAAYPLSAPVPDLAPIATITITDRAAGGTNTAPTISATTASPTTLVLP